MPAGLKAPADVALEGLAGLDRIGSREKSPRASALVRAQMLGLPWASNPKNSPCVSGEPTPASPFDAANFCKALSRLARHWIIPPALSFGFQALGLNELSA